MIVKRTVYTTLKQAIMNSAYAGFSVFLNLWKYLTITF